LKAKYFNVSPYINAIANAIVGYEIKGICFPMKLSGRVKSIPHAPPSRPLKLKKVVYKDKSV